MAKPIIIIQFPHPAPSEIMHRALNLIEDLHREADTRKLGSFDDMDHYGNGKFIFRVSAKRKIGEILSVIKKQLEHQNLSESAVVSREDE